MAEEEPHHEKTVEEVVAGEVHEDHEHEELQIDFCVEGELQQCEHPGSAYPKISDQNLFFGLKVRCFTTFFFILQPVFPNANQPNRL